MLNRIKSFFAFVKRPSLDHHDVILQQMEDTRSKATHTIEEHFRLRGFPYSRSIEKAGGRSL